MDVSLVSASLSQLEVMHTVAVHSQKMAMDTARSGGAIVMKMIDNLASIKDPALGGGIDLRA